MKLIPILILQFFILTLNAQIQEPPEIVDQFERAVSEFHKPFEHQDYSKSVELLEDLKRKYPDSTEIRYFLGYAYDRLNSKDAKSIPYINSNLTLLASKEFEYIINKEPKYTKRKLVLDPYSKVTAIWGSLALKYYYTSKIDSMGFALSEGKKRGGFQDILLEIGENVLKSCSKNSILFVSGDNFSFPILYAQQIEEFRKDVQVIDISLLNTDWYCSLIKNSSTKGFLKDSIDYNNIPRFAESSEQILSIPISKCADGSKVFIWEVDKLRNGKYILKGDSILKEIIIRNEFHNDIYFTVGQIKSDLLSLDNYFSDGILVNKINACSNGENDRIEDQINILNLESIFNESVKNSDDILQMIDMFRIVYATTINKKINDYDFDSAKLLLTDMERKLPYEFAPIQNERLKEYINKLKKEASR